MKAGYTRAAWVAEETDLKAYQVSRLAKWAIRSGWLCEAGHGLRHEVQHGQTEEVVGYSLTCLGSVLFNQKPCLVCLPINCDSKICYWRFSNQNYRRVFDHRRESIAY